MELKIKVKGIDSLFSFFAESEQIAYQSPHELIAQINDDACVAACARMLLADFGIDATESYLASALETEGGAYLSKIPQALKAFGLNKNYEWRNDLTIAELSKSLKRECAAVSLQRKNAKFGHSVIVDDIITDEIRLRDPLPLGQGKSYAVSIEKFSDVWLKSGVIYVK
ncbi:MAG: cysteine peptidase family C39 domain-containing protein [Pyrinomonadaceae bacterium]